MSQAVKRLSPREFQDAGFLQELNRQFLHPLGLALEVVVHEDGTTTFGEVWDCRDCPEGIVFADLGDAESARKKAAVEAELVRHIDPRRVEYGFVIQPVG
jgi:hypothetical protein